MKKILIILFFASFFVLPINLSAQPDPRYNGNGSNVGSIPVGPAGPAGAPIDGGLSIVLLLGVAYGTKSLLEMKKKRT